MVGAAGFEPTTPCPPGMILYGRSLLIYLHYVTFLYPNYPPFALNSINSLQNDREAICAG